MQILSELDAEFPRKYFKYIVHHAKLNFNNINAKYGLFGVVAYKISKLKFFG